MKRKLLANKIALVSCFDINWISHVVTPLVENGAHVTLITHVPRSSFSNQIDANLLKFITPIILDSHDLTQLDKTLKELLSSHPKIDIQLNAPIPVLNRNYLDTTSGDVINLFQHYLGFIFAIIRATGEVMLANRSGRIINIVSGLGRRGLPGTVAYSASQAAILGLTRSLGLEWAPFNINVNAIGIGWLASEQNLTGDFASITKFIPLRSIGHPDDIQGLLLYLLSPFSTYVTGSCINVDGGLISHA